VYKKEFDRFIAANRKDLIEHLNFVIDQDIIVFRGFWEQMGYTYSYYALHDLVDRIIPEVFKKFRLELSDRSWNGWLKSAGMRRREKKITKRPAIRAVQYERRVRQKELDIDDRLREVLPQWTRKLTREEVDASIDAKFPDSAHRLRSLFAENRFLYELVRLPYQLEPIVGHCVAINMQIPRQKTPFVLQYVRAVLVPFFENLEIESILQFAVHSEKNAWTYFTRGQFAEFARKNNCDPSLFDKMADRHLLANDNGWYRFLFPELVFAFNAIVFASSPRKAAVYQSEDRDWEFNHFKEMFPYLNWIDRTDFPALFYYPKIRQFVKAVDSREIKSLLKRYFRYFGVMFSCHLFRGKVKCTFSVTDHLLTHDLFAEWNIGLSEKILVNFPFESPFFKNEPNLRRCAGLVKYMGRKFMDQEDVAVASIKDEQFWTLLSQTEFAELIREEVDRLKGILAKEVRLQSAV
jgi:hypothetical protein